MFSTFIGVDKENGGFVGVAAKPFAQKKKKNNHVNHLIIITYFLIFFLS